MKKTNSHSLEDLVRIVADSARLTLETPEPGFFTVEQIAERCKVSTRHISRALARGYSAGKVERRTFRILSGSGRPYPVPHYRIKDSDKPSPGK